MSYTVSIRVRGQIIGSTCHQPVSNDVCERWQYYSLSATSGMGTSNELNVCAEHLFATIGYFLGMPAK